MSSIALAGATEEAAAKAGVSKRLSTSDTLQCMFGMFIVYMLRCSDRTYYIGMTSNPDQRLEEHERGKYHKCTYKRMPVELVWNHAFDNMHDSIVWEREIHGR